MKEYKLQLTDPNLTYYYFSDNILTEEEKAKKQELENELCKLICPSEIGVHSMNSFVSIKKKDGYFEVVIKGGDIELQE